MIPVLVFLFAYVFSQFYRSFLAVVASDLTRDLGLGPAELGNLTAIWFAAFALAQFPVGYLLDRHGPRRSVAAIMLLAAVGAAVFAMARGFGEALAGMALIGIGCSPILMGALYYFGRTKAPERFPLYTSIMIGLGGLGNLAGGRPLTMAAEGLGWRSAMLVIAALTALGALLVLLAVRDPPRVVSPGPKRKALGELWELVSYRPLRAILLINLLSYSVIAAERGLWLGPYLDQVHGLGQQQRGDAAFLMALGMSIGALLVTPLVPLFGSAKRVAVAGNCGAAACFLALALVPGLGSGAAIALLAAAGLFGMSYGAILSHTRLFLPEHLLGRGVTFANFLSIGGAGLVLSGSGYFVRGGLEGGAPPEQVFSMLHGGFAAILIFALVFYVRAPATPGAVTRS